MNQLARVGFHTLGLQTYLTAGPKESRAWTIHRGWTAPQAAGVIHTDFQRGFIKAEVVSFDDLVAAGSMAEAKASGQGPHRGQGLRHGRRRRGGVPLQRVSRCVCAEQWALGVAEDAEVQHWLAGLPKPKRQPNLVFAAARWHASSPRRHTTPCARPWCVTTAGSARRSWSGDADQRGRPAGHARPGVREPGGRPPRRAARGRRERGARACSPTVGPIDGTPTRGRSPSPDALVVRGEMRTSDVLPGGRLCSSDSAAVSAVRPTSSRCEIEIGLPLGWWDPVNQVDAAETQGGIDGGGRTVAALAALLLVGGCGEKSVSSAQNCAAPERCCPRTIFPRLPER